MVGNPREVTVAAVLPQSSMASLGLMRPLLPVVGGALIDINLRASSIGLLSSPAVRNRDYALPPWC